MKTLLTLLLVCSVYELQAQLIKFDYATRTYAPAVDHCVGKDASVSYQLTNFNTFANKASISGKLFNVSADIPAELATLFRIKADAENKLNNTEEQVDKMKAVEREASNKATAPAASASLRAEANAVRALVDSCNDYYEKAGKIKDALDFQKKLAETMADETHYNEVLMARVLYTKGINAAAIGALKTDFENFEIAYHKVYDQYEKASEAARDAGDKINEAKIESAEEQVEKDYNVLEDQYRETLASINNLFDKAINPANYNVTSLPIHVEDNADEVEFQIQVGEQKDDLSKINPFKKILKVEGGMKIDYSVGVVLKSISDEQYFLDNDKKLQRGNSAALTPGLAPMIHFYRRTCNSVGWGGMFGINADFKELTDVNLGFLGGLSVIVGRAQKIIFSAGISYSKVSRLKKGEFDVDKAYDDTDFNIENVTQRILKPSAFFSFSYSITNRRVMK